MSSSTNLTSSTINTDTTNYSVAEGQELVAQGKRHLLVSSVPEAVSTLALACSVLARHHGETSELCAEAYFHYGRALLEMSRIESTVLGNALEGVNMDEEKEEKKSDIVENTEGMTMDERGEIEEKVAEALEENFEKHDKIASIHLAEVEESEEDSSVDEDKMETGEEKMETEEAKSQEKMDTDKVEAEHTETDPGNLEQAWEMFELCKVIWGKAGNVARECEALICLGEVSMENENYAQAVEDIAACLAKRVQALPKDSRSIAETHYQLGVAQAHSGDYVKAGASLQAAVAVLRARLETIGKMEVSENLGREKEDLNTLIQEIEERMADHKDMEKGVYKEDKEFVSKHCEGGKAATTIGVRSAKQTAAATVGSA